MGLLELHTHVKRILVPRSKILKSMKVNDRVLIEKYTYRG